MNQVVSRLFSVLFMPQVLCYLGTPEILCLHAGADALTGDSYLAIAAGLPAMLGQLHLPEAAWMICLFSAFILVCGLVQFSSILLSGIRCTLSKLQSSGLRYSRTFAHDRLLFLDTIAGAFHKPASQRIQSG